MLHQKRGEPDTEAFEKDFGDAVGYHRRAEQFLEQGERVSLVFNVASCALERYLVAICDAFGVVPFNHNYAWLMKDVEQLLDIPSDLNTDIRSLDQIFGICSLDEYHHGTPEEPDMRRVLSMCDKVESLFSSKPLITMREACAHCSSNA